MFRLYAKQIASKFMHFSVSETGITLVTGISWLSYRDFCTCRRYSIFSVVEIVIERRKVGVAPYLAPYKERVSRWGYSFQ